MSSLIKKWKEDKKINKEEQRFSEIAKCSTVTSILMNKLAIKKPWNDSHTNTMQVCVNRKNLSKCKISDLDDMVRKHCEMAGVLCHASADSTDWDDYYCVEISVPKI